MAGSRTRSAVIRPVTASRSAPACSAPARTSPASSARSPVSASISAWTYSSRACSAPIPLTPRRSLRHRRMKASRSPASPPSVTGESFASRWGRSFASRPFPCLVTGSERLANHLQQDRAPVPSLLTARHPLPYLPGHCPRFPSRIAHPSPLYSLPVTRSRICRVTVLGSGGQQGQVPALPGPLLPGYLAGLQQHLPGVVVALDQAACDRIGEHLDRAVRPGHVLRVRSGLLGGGDVTSQ